MLVSRMEGEGDIMWYLLNFFVIDCEWVLVVIVLIFYWYVFYVYWLIGGVLWIFL